MSDRRHFLKQLALLGAVATTPVTFALGQPPEPTTESPASPTDGRFVVPHSQMRPTRPPRKITIPDVGEFNVLKGDFHIHTLFSDGLVMPKDRVAEAVDNGLDVISITDHIEYHPNITGGALKLAEKNDDQNLSFEFAQAEAEKNKLLLVRGAEITKSEWHFNALFVKDVNPIAALAMIGVECLPRP